MAELAALQPTRRERLMDLPDSVGMDVSDWANYAGGSQRAASNPRYCYEWAFIEPDKFVVLNLWYESFEEHGDQISQRGNLRSTLERHSQPGGKPQWARRAAVFDCAVRTAYVENLPVRAVICTGRRRGSDDTTPSKVKARSLDPVPWAVSEYDPATGDFTVLRGVRPRTAGVDQFDLAAGCLGPTERRHSSGEVYKRSAQIRAGALDRANGRCEWCGERGFATHGGAMFLETHHVVPLSEDGPDTVMNVVALCPNHHREAHHGVARDEIRSGLLGKLREWRSRVSSQGSGERATETGVDVT